MKKCFRNESVTHMSLSSMEVRSILALVILAILFQGIKADLFHKVSDDPHEQWSLSVYRAVPIKESASFMQKSAICKSDARCSGFTMNDLNLLLFDLNDNFSSSLFAEVFVNLGNQQFLSYNYVLTLFIYHKLLLLGIISYLS